MSKITLAMFCNQWVEGQGRRPIANRFEKNVFDFTTVIGNRTKMFFQASFSYGGFFGTGAKWAPRQSRWGRKLGHPVLRDTLALAKGIKREQDSYDRTNYQSRRGKNASIFRRGSKYHIYTTALSSPKKNKRGGGIRSYAAIHNSDPMKTNYTVNQYSSKKPVQRQFIGFSRRLDIDLFRQTDILFRGFPTND